MSEKISKTLGILGGLGPMSSVYFYEMLTEHTQALCDQQHLNILLSSRADTPDRTAFITGRSSDNPLYTMLGEVARLITAGADIIAIPCNTAHYFYDKISEEATVPVINIIRQTAVFCRREGVKRAGLFATDGTVASGAYAELFSAAGIECVIPSADEQEIISNIIYCQIKKGAEPDMTAFFKAADSMLAKGCDRLILGCTELSLLKRRECSRFRSDIFLDSLEVLAYSAIKMCGKTPVGFDDRLMNFAV